MMSLDDFTKGAWTRHQSQMFAQVMMRQSLLNKWFPAPPAKPLTLRERMARDLRIRANRLRDALKVLRGEADIYEGDD